MNYIVYYSRVQLSSYPVIRVKVTMGRSHKSRRSFDLYVHYPQPSCPTAFISSHLSLIVCVNKL